MNQRKAHSAAKGIVASANLDTVHTREIFFQVDPATLAHLDDQEVKDKFPRGTHLEFDPLPLLKFLPELEAEIFWLLYSKGKNQKDVAVLLKLSQPTVSYRYRRTLEKLAYLTVLTSLPIREMVNQLDFLNQGERDMLYDLLYCVNQEMVGKRHGRRQSSVKWVFVKTKDKLQQLEKTQPEKWSHLLALLFFLEDNLAIRVLH